MKKHYYLLISALLLDVTGALAQGNKDAYVFPIKPGTEQWRQFETGQAMVDATQIPTETLHKMSTEGLVETCLAYPLLPDLFAANDLQRGLDAVARNFNGLQELLRRPDAGQALTRIYQTMNPELVREKGAGKKGAFTFEFTYIELLLAQPTILEKLTPSERKSLAKESFEKFKAKDNNLEVFGGLGQATTALVIGRILQQEGFSSRYQPGKSTPAMQLFLATTQSQDPQIITQIIVDVQTFTK